MVKRVMSRLIPISGLGQYDWEIRVIDDPRAPTPPSQCLSGLLNPNTRLWLTTA